MTESEYINATNLAKLRIASHAVATCAGSCEQRMKVLDVLDPWIAMLEEVVRTEDVRDAVAP